MNKRYSYNIAANNGIIIAKTRMIASTIVTVLFDLEFLNILLFLSCEVFMDYRNDSKELNQNTIIYAHNTLENVKIEHNKTVI